MVFLAVFLTSVLGASARDPIGVVTPRVVDGVRVRTLEIDLANPHVRFSVEIARGFPHASEPFATMVARALPVVAIDGTYFSKTDYAPIGDIVTHGHLVYQGLMGTAMAITRDNDVTIRRVVPNHAEDWSRYETVLACGPALVLNGRIDVDPVGERFHDPHVMGEARRMGVALLRDRRLAIVETDDPVTFARLAQIMYDFGAIGAMNLDAGASLALYVRGRTLLAPGRQLTNILTISEEP
jgi:exopolysaccharide biosynthesis protein